jgi:hypothetical protein
LCCGSASGLLVWVCTPSNEATLQTVLLLLLLPCRLLEWGAAKGLLLLFSCI